MLDNSSSISSSSYEHGLFSAVWLMKHQYAPSFCTMLLALQFATAVLMPVILTVRACMCCFALSSKLTRESGTDFPIPMVPGTTDTETEKLIREKDEEVRHSPCQKPHEQTQHHEQHPEPEPRVDPPSEPPPSAEPHSKGS